MTDNRPQGAVAVQTDFERFALDHNAHVHCLGCNGCLIDPAFYIQSYPGHVWCMACRERIKANTPPGRELPWDRRWEL